MLIAPADAIPALRQKPFLQDSLVFSHTEADVALQRIRESIPLIVAVDCDFAESPAGQALLSAIRADPTLSTCQIQIVGVRQSPRYRVDDRVLLDGTTVQLLDISAGGAHVLSGAVLKPTQEVQVVLPVKSAPLPAVAVWVQFELPREGPQYRAGIQFAPSAAAVVAEYISKVTR